MVRDVGAQRCPIANLPGPLNPFRQSMDTTTATLTLLNRSHLHRERNPSQQETRQRRLSHRYYQLAPSHRHPTLCLSRYRPTPPDHPPTAKSSSPTPRRLTAEATPSRAAGEATATRASRSTRLKSAPALSKSQRRCGPRRRSRRSWLRRLPRRIRL